MTPWNRRLGRMAGRIQAAYGRQPLRSAVLELPELDWQDLQQRRQRLAIAEARGWQRAAAEGRQDLAYNLERIVDRLSQRIAELRSPIRRTLPNLRTLYEELRAADSEFDVLEFDGSTLSVTTEPIVLEGIPLGRFEIRLDLSRLGGESPYAVVALQPNPAATCSETTHPHVQSESLCAGEGRAAIDAALQEGRLYDFFVLVDRVLHSYGEGSAYVELNRWFGISCHDCDAVVDEDDAGSCYACGETLCGECLFGCHSCGTSYCSACIGDCAVCEERICSRCLAPCDRCRRMTCESCLEKTTCSDCMAEIEHEALEQHDSEEPARETTHAVPQPPL